MHYRHRPLLFCIACFKTGVVFKSTPQESLSSKALPVSNYVIVPPCNPESMNTQPVPCTVLLKYIKFCSNSNYKILLKRINGPAESIVRSFTLHISHINNFFCHYSWSVPGNIWICFLQSGRIQFKKRCYVIPMWYSYKAILDLLPCVSTVRACVCYLREDRWSMKRWEMLKIKKGRQKQEEKKKCEKRMVIVEGHWG